MGQISFCQNFPYVHQQSMQISNGTLSFYPFNIYESISFKTINMAFALNISSLAVFSYTFSLGLYSLNGSTLSLANSASVTGQTSNLLGNIVRKLYFSISNTSATQNITPGTWYFGFLATSALNSVTYSLQGAFTRASLRNAFPGKFIGGRMTVSTAGLPSSYATSDLDITGNDAMFVPYIILSS